MGKLRSTPGLYGLGFLLVPIMLVGCGGLDDAIPVTKNRAEIQSEIYVSEAEKRDAPYDHIYAYGDFLFASVEDEGVQVINNSDPFAPTPEMFLNIPGAKDVVIDNDIFITNQYADLVVFSISDQQEVSRINDLYNYKDYLEIPPTARWKDKKIAQNDVVVGFKIEEDKGVCFFFC